jgi:hypothetical protein
MMKFYLAAAVAGSAVLATGCFDADIAAEIDQFTYQEGDCPAATVAFIEDEALDLDNVTIDEIRDQLRANHGVETEELVDDVMECMRRA